MFAYVPHHNHKSALTHCVWLDSRRHDQATKSNFSVGDSPANHVPAGPSDRIVRALAFISWELRTDQAIMAKQMAEIEGLSNRISQQHDEPAAPAQASDRALSGAHE